MAMLKAILFDLDDTLIDWSHFDGNYYELELPHFTKMRQHLIDIDDEHDALLPPLGQMLEVFRTMAQAEWSIGRETMRSPHLPNILIALLKSFGIDTDKIDVDLLLKHYDWGAVSGVTVFPEVPETLQMLLDNGIEIGIVTNAFQTMAMRDKELEQFDLLRYFKKCRFAAADVGYLKPHPEIFHTALNCIGTKPEETVFVGDNLNADIAGALRVGMKAVWRDTGHHTSRIARDVIEPSATIVSLDEIVLSLDKWYPGWR